MGDKSPKDSAKKKDQKNSKNAAVDQKKKAAFDAKHQPAPAKAKKK